MGIGVGNRVRFAMVSAVSREYLGQGPPISNVTDFRMSEAYFHDYNAARS